MKYINFISSILLPLLYFFVLIQMCDEDSKWTMEISGLVLVMAHIISLTIIYFESINKLNVYRMYYKVTFWSFIVYGFMILLGEVFKPTPFNHFSLVLVIIWFISHMIYITTSATDLFDLDQQRRKSTTPKSKWDK